MSKIVLLRGLIVNNYVYTKLITEKNESDDVYSTIKNKIEQFNGEHKANFTVEQNISENGECTIFISNEVKEYDVAPLYIEKIINSFDDDENIEVSREKYYDLVAFCDHFEIEKEPEWIIFVKRTLEDKSF